LPTRVLELQEWCSGVSAMKWLMLLALVLGLVSWGTVALGVGQVVLLGLRSASLQGLGLGV
jgi:hypothetical protein